LSFNVESRFSDTSREVTQCWQQVLGRAVDESENFLDAGGTSLEALQLAKMLEKQFNCTLNETFVFEYSSIKTQTRYFKQLT